MDDLTNYVLTYFGRLMTSDEHQAFRRVHWKRKLRDTDSVEMARFLKRMAPVSPEMDEQIDHDGESVLRKIAERILREQGDEVFLNRCPRCSALARTPEAKQCPACFFDWHQQHTRQ